MKFEEFFPAGWSKKAAFIVLCIVLAVFAVILLSTTSLLQPKGTALPDYGFQIGDLNYDRIRSSDYPRFDLEKNCVITQDDIGELVGHVEYSKDERLRGCPVYQYTRYPDTIAIRILKEEEHYTFFTFSGYTSLLDAPVSSTKVLETYGVDASWSLEFFDDARTDYGEIYDQTVRESVLQLISGREPMKNGIVKQRRLDLWKAAYGTDDVYLDNSGSIRFTNKTAMDNERALWDKDTYTIWFTDPSGWIKLDFRYNPHLQYLWDGNNYYALSNEDLQQLNGLLGITISKIS